MARAGGLYQVCVSGPARSGKSFLLNCLTSPSSARRSSRPLPRRFVVSGSVQPCTRGLWMWVSPEPIQLPDGTKMRLLYVDTEGVGAVKATDQQDLIILALALLISSTFMFNSMGAIDERSISKLAFVTQLSSHLHITQGGADTSKDFETYFPHFVWILRDFSLQLKEGADGKAISAKEYLEGALRPERGTLDEDVARRNRIRMLLTTFFARRECHTLPRPVTDESALAALGGESADNLIREGFHAQLDTLVQVSHALHEIACSIWSFAAYRHGDSCPPCQSVESTLRPKLLHGRPLNGSLLGSLLVEYVAAINGGRVPTVAMGWSAVQKMIVQVARHPFASARDINHRTRTLHTPYDVR